MSPKKIHQCFNDVSNRCTLKLYKFIDKFLLSFCGTCDLFLSPSAIVFQTKMARTRQKRDVPVQKASAEASVPPGKKYKNAILAELVRERCKFESKQFLWHSIVYHIEQCKNDFPWLNNNNIYYFR